MITFKDLSQSKEGMNELSKETSGYSKTSDYEKDDNEFWIFMLAWLVCMQEHENEQLWKNFQEDIKHNSRFFPKSELLKKVENVSVYATNELSAGTVLYRAREYQDRDYLNNKEAVAFYKELNDFFPNINLQLEDINSESLMNIISIALSGDMSKLQKLCQNIMEIEENEKPFWGFDKKNCDAPPKECAKAGRANASGISFLYAATDPKTAIMEMRPQIGQHFNVCKIEIRRNILLFDFTYTPDKLEDNEYIKSGDLYAISKAFSKPNYGNSEDYIPTQYLCEYLRQKGFDGIKYKSALSPEGINVIIFNTDSADRAYEIVESRVFGVEDIDIKFEQIIPFESKFKTSRKKNDI